MNANIAVSRSLSSDILHPLIDFTDNLLKKALHISNFALFIITSIGSTIYESCLSLYYYLLSNMSDADFIAYSIHAHRRGLAPAQCKEFDEILKTASPELFTTLPRIVCKTFILTENNYIPDYIREEIYSAQRNIHLKKEDLALTNLLETKEQILRFTPKEKCELLYWDPSTTAEKQSPKVRSAIKSITSYASYMMQMQSFNNLLKAAL